MMKKYLIILIGLTILQSCGGKRFSSNQVDRFSYLLIKGQSANAKLYLDSDDSFITLGKDTEEYEHEDGGSASKIQISEGQHKVKIIREGKIIINKKFFVSPGNTFEVNL